MFTIFFKLKYSTKAIQIVFKNVQINSMNLNLKLNRITQLKRNNVESNCIECEQKMFAVFAACAILCVLIKIQCWLPLALSVY